VTGSTQAPLHRVDPREGLTEADFAALGEWLSRVLAFGQR
jgi:hypothetical protein